MKTLLPVLIGVTLALASATGSAEETDKDVLKLSIERKSLRDALNDWAQQTGNQLIAEIKGEFVAPKVEGKLTAEEALERLLEGTSLTYEWMGERLVAVKEKGQVLPAALHEINTSARDGKLRVARLSAGQDGTHMVLPVATTPAQGANPDDQRRLDTPENGALEEIIVTGTYIRGAAPVGSDVVVIGRSEIEESGYARVQDLLETFPQTFAGISEDFNQQGPLNYNRGAEVQLRGLGPGTTLTLVNGRRQPAGGLRGAFVDISTIPTAAIERVEILSDGASATYGSDAIGGVVNLILRKDYEGAETRVSFGSAGGDADELQLSQLFGRSWERGNALIGYQYYERESLIGTERNSTATNGDQRSRGGGDYRTFNSNPGTIFDPSTFEPAYAIPRGQDGTSLSPADLLAGSANYTDYANGALLPQQKMHSVFGHVTQQLHDNLEVFADALFSSRDTVFRSHGFTSQTVFVPPTNPFYVDPFGTGEPVVVGYDFTADVGPATDTGTTDFIGVTLGTTIRLAEAWTLTLAGTGGREKNSWQQANLISFDALEAALADPNPATALNVFGDGSHTNQETIDALRVTESSEALSRVWSANAVVEGPILQLPGGAARLAFGADYRKETLSIDEPLFDLEAEDKLSVGAVFAEVRVPIFGRENTRRGVKRLELSAAARYDDYNTFGDTTNPKFGLSWAPLEFLTFHGTWGKSYRAPPFVDTSQDLSRLLYRTATVFDPLSATGRSKVLLITGNNLDLEPETATTWTAGVSITPAQLNLSASLTYFNIEYRDKIGTSPSPNLVLGLEDQWFPVVQRNPSQSQLAPLCSQLSSGNCSGFIAAIIDGRKRNLAFVAVDGVDAHVAYSVPTSLGDFRLRLGATYTSGYEQAVTQPAPAVDIVDTVLNPLTLRARGVLSWSRNGWHASAGVVYANGYQESTASNRHVSAWTTVDAGIGHQFAKGPGFLSGTKLQLTVTNLLNKEPPFVDNFYGFDPANGNLTGRLISAQLTKDW